MSATASSKEEVLGRLEAAGMDIRSFGVRRLGLFGSFARRGQGPASDVDLLVEFEPGAKSFDNFMSLSFLLEDALQRPVELVTRESLSPFIGPRILAEVEDVPLGL